MAEKVCEIVATIGYKYQSNQIINKNVEAIIKDYLDRVPVNGVICNREIQEAILGRPYEKSVMFSRFCGEIINNDGRFVKISRPYTIEYGRQRCWQKTRAEKEIE